MILSNKHKVKNSLIVMFFIVIILSSITFFLIADLKNKLNNVPDNSYNITILDNNLFQLKEDLFLFVDNEHEQLFFDLKEDKYTNKVLLDIENCDKLTENLSENFIDNKNIIKYNFVEINRLLKKFNNKFKLLTNNILKIGNENTGYTESIIYIEKKLERKITIFGNNDILDKFNNLKKQRQLFSEEKSFVYSKKFISKSKQLLDEQIFKNIDTTNNYGSRQIIDALSEYDNTFVLYKNLFVENGINYKTGITVEMLEIIQTIQVLLSEVIPVVNNRNREIKSLNKYLIILILVIYLLITGFLIILFFKSFQEKINKLNKIVSDLFSVDNEKLKNDFENILTTLNLHSEDLKKKEIFINDIISENYETDINFVNKNDRISKSLMKLKIKLKKEKISNIELHKERETSDKITLELAKFENIFRRHTNSDNKQLNFEIISNLVRYLDANIGGIYFIKKIGNKKVLYIDSAYAFNQEKIITKIIELGEGLVGTAAIEKTTFYINKLPEDYLKIVTAFGNTKPKALLIVPIMLGEKVFGIIELASLNDFNKNDIKFVETLGNDMASTLSVSGYIYLSTE